MNLGTVAAGDGISRAVELFWRPSGDGQQRLPAGVVSSSHPGTFMTSHW